MRLDFSCSGGSRSCISTLPDDGGDSGVDTVAHLSGRHGRISGECLILETGRSVSKFTPIFLATGTVSLLQFGLIIGWRICLLCFAPWPWSWPAFGGAL